MLHARLFIGPDPLAVDRRSNSINVKQSDKKNSNLIIDSFENECDIAIYGKLPLTLTKSMCSYQNIIIKYRLVFDGKDEDVSSETEEESESETIVMSSLIKEYETILTCNLDGSFGDKVCVFLDETGYYQCFVQMYYKDNKRSIWEIQALNNINKVVIHAQLDE